MEASRNVALRAILWVLATLMLASACNNTLDSRGATYDNVRFETYLKASPPKAGAKLGQTIAIDETMLVTSAPFEEVDGSDGAGALYVFDVHHPSAPPRRLITPNADPGDGSVTPEEVPGNVGNTDRWGALPIALSKDWIAVGAPGEDSGLAVGDGVAVEDAQANNDATEAGAVYLYRRAALDDQPTYLKAPYPAASDLFGGSVAMTDEWLAVAAVGDSSGDPEDDTDTGAPYSGAVYVYRYDEAHGSFVLRQFLKAPSIHEEDLFGASVAIEGDLLVVGATQDDGSGTGLDGDYDDRKVKDSGAVYTFRLNGEHWEFQSYIKSQIAEPGVKFGWSVRLFDGQLAVGEPFASHCPGEQAAQWANGAVYVIGDEGAGDFQCLSSPGHQNGTLFGFAIAGYARRLVVGAAWEPPLRTGAAYTFELDASGTWQQRPTLVAPNHEQDDAFGAAVGINSREIAVGAFGESGAQSDKHADLSDNTATSSGAVYLYSM